MSGEKGLTQKSAKKRTFGVSPLWFLYILPNGTKFRLCSPPHLRHQGQLLVPSGFFEKIVGSTNQPPFDGNFLEASQDKATKPAILFDLPKYTLNVGLALAVSGLPFFTLQPFAGFLFLFMIDGVPLRGSSILGSRAGRTERTSFAFMALVVSGDRGVS